MMSTKQEFLFFIIVGAINTALGYVLYLLFLLFLPYTVAYSVTYVLGIFISYYLNSRFVFRLPFSLSKALRFPIVYLVQYGLGVLLLRTLVEIFSIDRAIAPILVIIVTIPVTFILSRLVLRGRPIPTPPTDESKANI
jgi:putative flippase GtrA